MSDELDTVIERCVSLLTQEPARTREEVAVLLNRWEDMGLISRQMRAIIVQRLRASITWKHPTTSDSDAAE